MEEDLAVQLAMVQIDAANRLHERLTGWQVTGDAVRALMCAFLGLKIVCKFCLGSKPVPG